VRLVDPLVNDRDLDPLAGVLQAGPPERRRADLLRAAVELGAIADARVDALDAGERREPPELGTRHDDRHPVRYEPVAPADLGVRDRALDPAREGGLRGDHRVRLKLPARGPARRSERLLREADDDLDELFGGNASLSAGGSDGERQDGEHGDEKTPAHRRSW
jgi:hypothetical protein